MTAAATMMHSTKVTILLSLNAVAILVAGILIASALGLDLGNFHVVNARNDEISDALEADDVNATSAASGGNGSAVTGSGGMMPDGTLSSGSHGWISSDPVKGGELWNEDEITIYQSADIDLCVGGGLSNLGDMYWQTSNSSVISGFFSGARTWLGYDSTVCRYPVIAGVGTTTITAGTYDGSRRDQIKVNVLEIPVESWKRQVLTLTNKYRAEHGLSNLEWGSTCERAAQIRAEELIKKYDHVRPDGSEWSTACEAPAGTKVGENLMAGNAATSPELVVAAWINSKTHRENLLNPAFTKLSVGLVFDPSTKYQIYWSQFFSNY